MGLDDRAIAQQDARQAGGAEEALVVVPARMEHKMSKTLRRSTRA